MKKILMTVSALSMITALNIASSYADNMAVETALKDRPDLSNFYQLLISTGVNHELKDHTSYTIFAPTNEAIAKFQPDPNSCFYKPECAVPAAQIIRNHIIPGNVDITDSTAYKGGLFSINKRMVHVGQPDKNDFAIDGNNIVYSSMFNFTMGMLYKTDGVIANPSEISSLQPTYSDRESTTVTKKTIANAACGPEGCPDETTQTTTIVHTTATNPTVPVQ